MKVAINLPMIKIQVFPREEPQLALETGQSILMERNKLLSLENMN